MTAITSRRPARINPDRLPVLIIAVALTMGLAAVSFALSFAGLVGVSSWAHVPPELIWAVPVMLDSAILVYTLAILVKRERREGAAGTWVILTLWTAVSVAANAAHAWDVPGDWQRGIGTVIAGLAPIALLLAVHTIADLIVAPVTAAAAQDADTGQADTGQQADTDDEDTPAGPSASAPVADTTSVRTAATVVRRHPAPRPRAGVRAADYRDEILQLRRNGLSVRAIAEQVDIGKTAVAELLRTDTAAA